MARKSIVSLSVCTLALTACGGNGGDEAPAPGAEGGGDGGGVVVGSFGGDTDEFLQQSVHTYLDEYGDGIDVVLDGAEAQARITQLIAEGDGEVGSWDIVAMTDRDVPDLVEQGLFQELDQDLITNSENIVDGLESDYCVPHIVSPLTVIYNSEEIDMDFSTWEAVFTDEFLAEAGTNETWVDYFFYASIMIEAGGDPGSDLEPGYDRVAEIAGDLLSYGSPTQLGQGLMSGEVNATIGPRARGAQWTSESGVPFETVIPDEGTFNSAFYYCIPANAENPEAAHAYLDALLDPRGQEYFAENFFYAPTVTNVELDPELQDQVGITEEEAERIWSPDLAQISEQTADARSVWADNS